MFELEALHAMLIVRCTRRQHLDRDVAREERVVRAR